MDSGDPALAYVDEIVALLERAEALQSKKVLDLARRLLPHLTAEDIRNPHDFPALEDPDWHFEDGQLTGIQSVKVAIRSMSRELQPDGEAGEGEESGRAGEGATQGP